MEKSCALLSFFICPNMPDQMAAKTIAYTRKSRKYSNEIINKKSSAEMQVCPFQNSLCFMHSHPVSTVYQNKSANNENR